MGSPGPMDATTIRVREPRELLALLPYQLGFRPQESAVAVSLRPPRGRVGLVARVDLRDLGEVVDGPQLARSLVSHLVSDGARRAVLVLYTAEDPRLAGSGRGATRAALARAADSRAAAEQLREAAEPFLGDVPVWVVVHSGYLALDCTDDDCCPPGGRPLRDLEGTAVSAHMVLAGALVEDSREDLVRIPPASAGARRNTVRVADRWRARRASADLAGARRLDRWCAEGLAAWRTALDRSLAGDAPARPALLGRIEASLTDVRVRDAVLLALVPGTGNLPERSLVGRADRPEAEIAHGTSDALGAILDSRRGLPPDDVLVAAGAEVLERVVAHAHGKYQAPALTLLAVLAWWQGDGARASVLLDRALAVDPNHRLALLLGEVLAGGLAPGWVRRPV